MRRIVVSTTLLALALPFAASAGLRTPGDGTLSVRDLDGYVTISARGGVIGRCDQCSLLLNERPGADEIIPVVSGGRGIDIDDDGAKERYVGKDLRWKVIGGSFLMIVRRGTDVDLSVVGRGGGGIFGTKGSYVLNGQTTLVAPGPDPVQFRLSPNPNPATP
jgi:hypothetical protein